MLLFFRTQAKAMEAHRVSFYTKINDDTGVGCRELTIIKTSDCNLADVLKLYN